MSQQSDAPQKQKQEFITLRVAEIGFVVYGIGGGGNWCDFRGQPLTHYLDGLWQIMISLKGELNGSQEKVDRNHPHNHANRAIIERYLAVAAWAYALARELSPFQEKCLDGPTNPLRSIYIERLEEIFTKCFSAAYIFGNADEKMIGKAGLINDFEVNGGIDRKTGGEGCGFSLSIRNYYLAHFAPNNCEPILYERFGELMESIGAVVVEYYSQVAPRFAGEIKSLLESNRIGFGNKTVSSKAKTAMMEKLSKLIDRMLDVKVSAKRQTKVS